MSPSYKEYVFKHLLNTALNWTFFLLWTSKSTWQSVQYFDASIVHTFLKMQVVGSWFMSMVFIPCINTVYSGICSKIFWIICTKFYVFKTCSTFFCLYDTHMDAWNVCMYVRVCVCSFYVCSLLKLYIVYNTYSLLTNFMPLHSLAG